MKLLLALFTACFLGACAKTRTPAHPSTVKEPPTSTREFRLAFAYPPYSVEAPKIRKIPRNAEAALVRIRESLLAGAESPDPAKLPMAYVYELQGAEAGGWQSLGLVDGLGRFVKTEKDDHGVKIVPRFTDERATRVLRQQIDEMALEEHPTSGVVDPAPKPREGLPIEGRPGFMRSPNDPQGRPIDVRGMPKRTEVEDPYFPGKTLLVP